MTIENHPMVDQALEGIKAADARVGMSKSGYYPDISVDASYARLSPVATISLPDMGKFKLYPENNWDMHLGIQEMIYDFGRTSSGIKYAKSNLQTANDNLNLIKTNLAYQAISLFYSILITRQNISVLNEQIDALNQHLQISQKKAASGSATNFDVLTTQVRVAAATNDLIDAENALSSQEISLRQLTGLPMEKPVLLNGELSYSSASFNPDSLISTALDQRQELIIAKNNARSMELQMKMASLSDRPILGAMFDAGYKNGYVPKLNALKFNIVAGLQLEIPLFNGYRTRYKVNESRANLNMIQSRIDDLNRMITAEVEQAISSEQASLNKIQNSDIQVRQASEAVSMAKTRYEAGVITNLDLLDTQTTLAQAKLIHLKAIYNYIVSKNALDKATGKKVW